MWVLRSQEQYRWSDELCCLCAPSQHAFVGWNGTFSKQQYFLAPVQTAPSKPNARMGARFEPQAWKSIAPNLDAGAQVKICIFFSLNKNLRLSFFVRGMRCDHLDSLSKTVLPYAAERSGKNPALPPLQTCKRGDPIYTQAYSHTPIHTVGRRMIVGKFVTILYSCRTTVCVATTFVSSRAMLYSWLHTTKNNQDLPKNASRTLTKCSGFSEVLGCYGKNQTTLYFFMSKVCIMYLHYWM